MLIRHPDSARGNDLYETPEVATLALLRAEPLPRSIWEPACGRGAIVRVLRNAGHGVIAKFSRGGGLSGALTSVLGISTGGCTVMGCGAPVIPVVGLVFSGLSSGALVLLAQLSRIATAVVFGAVTAGVVYLGWLAGRR